jgi:hypothetical protein
MQAVGLAPLPEHVTSHVSLPIGVGYVSGMAGSGLLGR